MTGDLSFEEAKKAGSNARKEYLKAHLKIFLRATAICYICILLNFIFKLSLGIDIACLLTTPVKFQNYVDNTDRKEEING